ncbi:MAG: hypothetical protein NZ846_11335 [Thermus sp.]|nr:hypothetical protein [Thermus sp.]MCS7219539.1 hypothetical protein [Thermus sp.]
MEPLLAPKGPLEAFGKDDLEPGGKTLPFFRTPGGMGGVAPALASPLLAL